MACAVAAWLLMGVGGGHGDPGDRRGRGTWRVSAHTLSRCRHRRGLAAVRRRRPGLAGHQPAAVHHVGGGLPRQDQDHPAGQGHDPGSGADRDVPAVPGQGDVPRLAGHRGEPPRRRERGPPTMPGTGPMGPGTRPAQRPGRTGPAWPPAGPMAAGWRVRAGGPVPPASPAGLRVPGVLRPFWPGIVQQPGRLGTVGPLAHQPESGLAGQYRAVQQVRFAGSRRCRGPVVFGRVGQQAARAGCRLARPAAQAAQALTRSWPVSPHRIRPAWPACAPPSAATHCPVIPLETWHVPNSHAPPAQMRADQANLATPASGTVAKHHKAGQGRGASAGVTALASVLRTFRRAIPVQSPSGVRLSRGGTGSRRGHPDRTAVTWLASRSPGSREAPGWPRVAARGRAQVAGPGGRCVRS